MTNPMIRIIDGDTVTDCEMTNAEAAAHKKINDDATAAADAHTAAKTSAIAKLAALGLTADEIAAL